MWATSWPILISRCAALHPSETGNTVAGIRLNRQTFVRDCLSAPTTAPIVFSAQQEQCVFNALEFGDRPHLDSDRQIQREIIGSLVYLVGIVSLFIRYLEREVPVG